MKIEEDENIMFYTGRIGTDCLCVEGGSTSESVGHYLFVITE